MESLLQDESVSFDWHGGLMLKVLEYGLEDALLNKGRNRMEIIDSHAHLDMPEFDVDREQVISRASIEWNFQDHHHRYRLTLQHQGDRTGGEISGGPGFGGNSSSGVQQAKERGHYTNCPVWLNTRRSWQSERPGWTSFVIIPQKKINSQYCNGSWK